jgi:foldase protein PrsA
MGRFCDSGRRVAACGVLAAVVVLALAGCGGSGSTGGGSGGAGGDPGTASVSSVDAVSEPGAVVARVGGQVITKAAFAHALAGVIKSEGPSLVAPVPPDFTLCIQHMQATAPSGSRPSTAAARSTCRSQYQMFLTQALDHLISQEWVIGGAAEAGVKVSEAEVQQDLKRIAHGRSRAQVAARLAVYGETLADFALDTKVQLLAEGIRHQIAVRTEHVTQAQVVSYYNQNKRLFGVPRRRVLEIARAGTEAEALKIKRELASGRSFASVVKNLPDQPIYSTDGLVAGYESGLYRERPLNQAIFAAKPNVLSGPVKIFLGYYVFEVKRTLPAIQDSLAQVQATIKARLPNEMYKTAIAAFIKNWRARWKAKTTCQSGYLVAKCSSAPADPNEDAYTLG